MDSIFKEITHYYRLNLIKCYPINKRKKNSQKGSNRLAYRLKLQQAWPLSSLKMEMSLIKLILITMNMPNLMLSTFKTTNLSRYKSQGKESNRKHHSSSWTKICKLTLKMKHPSQFQQRSQYMILHFLTSKTSHWQWVHYRRRDVWSERRVATTSLKLRLRWLIKKSSMN